MKWLVFSDSHGMLDYMKEAVEKEAPDKILHLGDMARDAQHLQKAFPDIPVEGVLGNCDGYAAVEDGEVEKTLFFEGKRVWMLHGHTYHVKMGIGMLTAAARAGEADIVLFGHTHEPTCFLEGPLWVMNPGTVSGRPAATYGVIEGEQGKVNCRIASARQSVWGKIMGK